MGHIVILYHPCMHTRHDIKEYESRITGLTSDLQSCTSDNSRLQVMLTELQYGHETSKANMEGAILSLKV